VKHKKEKYFAVKGIEDWLLNIASD
jgi:hypothetical protein